MIEKISANLEKNAEDWGAAVTSASNIPKVLKHKISKVKKSVSKRGATGHLKKVVKVKGKKAIKDFKRKPLKAKIKMVAKGLLASYPYSLHLI